MKGQGYVSVKSEDTASAPADNGTVRLAIVVSALSCAVSLCAIAFIVVSLKSN